MKELSVYTNSIKNFLENYFSRNSLKISNINRWGMDIAEKFKNFSLKGKMLRGALLLLSTEMFKKMVTPGDVKVASALEIIHSSLLIHDDIMDRDLTRRGGKTIHSQYTDIFKDLSKQEAYHFGESLGICAGDIGFFIAFNILSESELTSEIITSIVSLWSEELSYVGLAQMEDLWFSTVNIDDIDINDVAKMYRFKTSRYSFSLPLMTGAILSGQNERIVEVLKNLGEDMGLLFQVKDDELGLFGSEYKTGKPVGSDLKEGKKTIYIIQILHNTDKRDREEVINIIRNRDSSPSAIARLKYIAKRSGAIDDINTMFEDVKAKCMEKISQLPVDPAYKERLRKITDFIIKREL